MCPTPRVKITDINIDCLEVVFKYLSIVDLLSIADSNKFLRNAAELVFILKYGKKRVDIFDLNSVRPEISTGMHTIEISGLKSSLQIIRCFGKFISKLKVSCSLADIENHISFNRLMTYISENCTESLTEIGLFDCLEGSLKNLIPFPKVEKVCTDISDLSGSALNFLFPNMRYLQFSVFCHANFTSFDIHYPHLEHMEIIVRGLCMIKYPGTALQVNSILQLNPKLQSLYVPSSFCSYLPNISNSLPNVKNFGLHLSSTHPSYGGKSLHLENVSNFHLSTDSEFLLLPFVFKLLREFTLDTYYFRSNEEFYTFIRENPSIEKITILSFYKPETKMNIPRMAKILPSTKEIHFRNCYFTSDEVIEFVNLFKSLEHFSFGLKYQSEFDSLKSRLGNGWHKSKNISTKRSSRFASRRKVNDHKPYLDMFFEIKKKLDV